MSGVVGLGGWLRVLATGTGLRSSVGKVQVNQLFFGHCCSGSGWSKPAVLCWTQCLDLQDLLGPVSTIQGTVGFLSLCDGSTSLCVPAGG